MFRPTATWPCTCVPWKDSFPCRPVSSALATAPWCGDVRQKILEYVSHRREREAKLLEAVRCGVEDPEAMVKRVYTDVPEQFHPMAYFTVLAHLEKLVDEGKVRKIDGAERYVPGGDYPLNALPLMGAASPSVKLGKLLHGCISLMVVLQLLLLPHCARGPAGEPPVRRIMKPMMGTLVEVLWRESREDPDAADRVRSVLERMEALAAEMNLHSSGSELSRINAAAGLRPVKVSADMMAVVGKALDVSALTRGAFDPTVGSVEAAWGDVQWEGSRGTVPADDELRNALDRVGYLSVVRDTAEQTVFLRKGGARLDLGGIAKGYIIDRGAAWLRSNGLACVMINAGGDIRASGCPQRSPWRVGLQDPFDKGRLLGVFFLRQGAVVTSGSYERFFENEQGRFSHIVDPRTGRPVQGLLSVTVVSLDATLADALATAFMVSGREAALELLAGLPFAAAVFVEADGTIWVDKSLKRLFEPAECVPPYEGTVLRRTRGRLSPHPPSLRTQTEN